MKWFLLNIVYRIFVVVTLPIAVLEILFKNVYYGLQFTWWDLRHEFDFVWKDLKWGLNEDKKQHEENIRKVMSNKQENK